MNMLQTVRGWLGKAMPEGPQGLMRGVFPVSTSEPPIMGTRELLEGYEQMPWLRAIADKVGNGVACTEWELYVPKRGGKLVRDAALQRSSAEVRQKLVASYRSKGELVEVQDHLFLEALNNPNPFMGRVTLLKVTEVHFDLVGDAFWVKERNGLGAPVGFWPVPPQWVIHTPTPARPTFRISWKAWQVEIPDTEIVWFHEPAPANPYTRGTGIGWALGDEIEVDEYAAKMAKQLFFNRARPDFVVMGGEGSSETEMKRLERDWLNRLQGFWRAHRPYFLTGKVEIKEFQQPTMEQLVYPALRKAQRDIILQVWGEPPEMFGIVENSNRATIEAAEYLHTKHVICPKVERMRWVLQRFIQADYDPRLVLVYESPITEDKAHQLAVAKAAPHALRVDEWRGLQGFAPIGGEVGNAHLVPMNSYLTDDPLDPKKRPAAPAPGSMGPPKEDPEADDIPPEKSA